MNTIRLSTTADIPALRDLWVLAFGDGGDYLDNFFSRYYRPERMIVLEEGGQVRAMTAWFDTQLVLGETHWRAAYLYAVATHPACRGRGLAGELLAWADDHFRALSIPAVTTVPAEPSLHNFFGANGFVECFSHTRGVAPSTAAEKRCTLTPISSAEYGRMREELLAGTAHICFPVDALFYQEGCCAISGGGLYRGETPFGPALLCAEGMENGELMLKELLGSPQAREILRDELALHLPAFGGLYRVPGPEVPFGMVKWLSEEGKTTWSGQKDVYLGLGFD